MNSTYQLRRTKSNENDVCVKHILMEWLKSIYVSLENNYLWPCPVNYMVSGHIGFGFNMNNDTFIVK